MNMHFGYGWHGKHAKVDINMMSNAESKWKAILFKLTQNLEQEKMVFYDSSQQRSTNGAREIHEHVQCKTQRKLDSRATTWPGVPGVLLFCLQYIPLELEGLTNCRWSCLPVCLQAIFGTTVQRLNSANRALKQDNKYLSMWIRHH